MEWHDPTISCNRALQGIGGCEDERVQHADHVGMRIVAGGGRVDELYPAQAQQRTRQLPWGRASQAGAAAGGSPHRISQLVSAFEACSRPTQQCNRALSSASRNKPALRRAAELAQPNGLDCSSRTCAPSVPHHHLSGICSSRLCRDRPGPLRRRPCAQHRLRTHTAMLFERRIYSRSIAPLITKYYHNYIRLQDTHCVLLSLRDTGISGKYTKPRFKLLPHTCFRVFGAC